MDQPDETDAGIRGLLVEMMQSHRGWERDLGDALIFAWDRPWLMRVMLVATIAMVVWRICRRLGRDPQIDPDEETARIERETARIRGT